tara:strand:+ start:378 stop:881 length:504 start_codon:yes stop_codon:yes gene_type:complete
MQKRLQTKCDNYLNNFKSDIKNIMTAENDSEDKSNDLLQYIYDYPNLTLTKEDFQKRKRAKNSVPWHDRCCALKAEAIQCTRRKKEGETFCGTHLKGTPHGIVNEGKKVENKFKKVQIISEEIDGIIYHLDDGGNIYDPQDIHQNLENPKIIAKWKKDTNGKYHILK